jgi:hypothetical protein
MKSKVLAARTALYYGCNSIIAFGLKRTPLASARQTGCCTIVCHAIDTLLVDSLQPFAGIKAS